MTLPRHWLTRPRWILAVVAALAFLAWLVWPVPIRKVSTNTFLAMTPTPKGGHEFIGVARIETHDTPWEAWKSFRKIAAVANSQIVRDLGDSACWSPDGATLAYRRDNLVWRYELAKAPPAGLDPGTALENTARDYDRKIVADRFEHATVERTPRALIWLKDRWPAWQKTARGWFESP